MSFHHDQRHPPPHTDCIERDQPGKSNLLQLAACVMAILATAITLFSLYLTILLHWDGPFRDLWEFVDDIERQFHGDWSLDYLLEAYGGAHRIFLPKLLFFADYYFLGGRNILTTTSALLCQLLYFWLITSMLRRDCSLRTGEKIILGAGFTLALFSTSQVSNFLYAMDVQWYMSNLFGLASITLLARPANQRAWLPILLAAIAAALCNFTGLMVLPVAALALLLDKQFPQKQKLLLPVIAFLCLLYVSHLKNSEQFVVSALRRSDNLITSGYIVFDTLWKMVPYTLRYLASPLTRDWPVSGSILSVMGLTVILYYWRQHYRGKLTDWQKLCLYIATSIAASAVFTAFGRLIYPNSATAERYQTLVLPWLPALFGLLWPDLRQQRHHQVFLLVWLSIFGLHILPTQPASAKAMAELSYRVNLAHTAARAGVLSPPYITASLSYPLIKNNINSVRDNDSFLRNNRLGYFRHLAQFALGNHINSNTDTATCTGSASMQRDDKTATWLIDGQMLADGKPVADIALTQGDKVVGLGILLRPIDSLLPATAQPGESSHFRAFATTENLQGNTPVVLLGITDGAVVCHYTLP